MRKQDPTQIKILHKKFHFMTKSDISAIYDFCDQDFAKTEKVLTIAKDTRCPNMIVKTLLQRPQKGYSMIASFQKRYDEQYGQLKNSSNIKQVKQQTFMFNFFKYIPNDALHLIEVFLDPYSMANFSMTCSRMHKFSLSSAFQQYFKNLCINLFQKIKARLPDPCRFIEVRNYVIRQGKQFGPNTRNAVNNKLRYYVWQKQTNIEQLDKNYLQSFGSYKNLYFKLPRVHFNGIYMCKHQYRKQEQKNLLTNTGQVHFVSYYRYFRFIQDGTVISAVFPSKQKLQTMADLLTANVLQMDANFISKNLMIGEYMQTGNTIQAKLFKQGAIFTFVFSIVNGQNHNKNQIANMLVLKHYGLKVVDQKQIVQVLQQGNSKNPVIFTYSFIPSLRKENSALVKSSSL